MTEKLVIIGMAWRQAVCLSICFEAAPASSMSRSSMPSRGELQSPNAFAGSLRREDIRARLSPTAKIGYVANSVTLHKSSPVVQIDRTGEAGIISQRHFCRLRQADHCHWLKSLHPTSSGP